MQSATDANRRNVLKMAAGLAVPAVVALPVAASAGNDPFFAAIEAHRRAYVALDNAVTRNGQLEQDLPKELRRSNQWEDDEATIYPDDDPRWVASIKELEACMEAEQAAALALLDVMPTTAAGVSAGLHYASDFIRRGGEWPGGLQDEGDLNYARGDWEFFFFAHMADAVDALT